jgi:hypothetical protein
MDVIKGATYLGTPCKNGHDGYRYSKGGGCVACVKLGSQKWHEHNKEKTKILKHEWHLKNAEYKRNKTKEYYKNYTEKAISSIKKWKQNNPGKVSAIEANRRANFLLRTPKWLTHEQLEQIYIKYSLAEWCSNVMHEKYHVDHIVPLQGKCVSGLHVPWNLQVIRAKENLSKGNRFKE